MEATRVALVVRAVAAEDPGRSPWGDGGVILEGEDQSLPAGLQLSSPARGSENYCGNSWEQDTHSVGCRVTESRVVALLGHALVSDWLPLAKEPLAKALVSCVRAALRHLERGIRDFSSVDRVSGAVILQIMEQVRRGRCSSLICF